MKTRLVPALGEDGAAELYRAFVEDACTRLAPRVRLALAVASPVAKGWIGTVARRHRLPLLSQGEGDLGARMRRLATEALRSTSRVVLLGSDAPTLPVAHVRAAIRALARARVVLGPSLDGGYHLIGLRAPVPDVFTRMPWSTDRVLARTFARLRRLRIAPVLLPCWYDVDTPADVDLLTRHLATCAVLGETPCPRTRRVLARLRRGAESARRRSVASGAAAHRTQVAAR